MPLAAVPGFLWPGQGETCLMVSWFPGSHLAQMWGPGPPSSGRQDSEAGAGEVGDPQGYGSLVAGT